MVSMKNGLPGEAVATLAGGALWSEAGRVLALSLAVRNVKVLIMNPHTVIPQAVQV